MNVNPDRLGAMHLPPGPWVKRLRGPRAGPGETVTLGETTYSLAALQDELLVVTPGDSVAYLTDFRMDATAREYLAERLRGVGTVVCECQYRTADRAFRIWDADGCRELSSFGGAAGDRIGCAAFAPDGLVALSGGSEPTLRLWKLTR